SLCRAAPRMTRVRRAALSPAGHVCPCAEVLVPPTTCDDCAERRLLRCGSQLTCVCSDGSGTQIARPREAANRLSLCQQLLHVRNIIDVQCGFCAGVVC